MFTYALADTAEALPRSSTLINLVPLIIIFIFFYMFIIRPQQKKVKEQSQMLSLLKKGDKVMTAGGIIGLIEKIDPNNSLVTLEIAPSVFITLAKSFISEVIIAKPN